MNPTAIYSKTGKGVQEASGKTNFLSRGDRAILAAIDGKISVQQLSAKFDRAADEKFFAVISKMDADGFIREVSPGTVQRGAANAPRATPSKPPPKAGSKGGEDLDFTQIFSAPPKMDRPSVPASRPAPSAPPSKDPMAAAREAAEQRTRVEREAKAKADAAEKAALMSTQQFRLDAELRAKVEREKVMAAAAEGKTRAEIEARERAEREAKTRAEAEAKARVEAATRARAEAERKAQEAAARAAREAQERAGREARDKAQAAERGRYEAAERARREAEELRFKIEEERRAREEAERRAREEAERTRRQAEERARREAEEKKALAEAEELRRKYEEEKKAREEAERRADEERQRRDQHRLEEERKAREEYERQEAERRAAEDAERAVHEAEERKEAEEHQRQIRMAREAEDKKRRDAEAKKKKEQEAKRWEVEEARRKADDAYRQRAEQEDKERAERETVEAAERAEAEKRAAAEADALAGSLLADLDTFSSRQDEERKAEEAEQRRERAEAERRQQEAQAQREEAERNARKAEERRRREEEERRAREEAEQREREEEARSKEAEEERKRKDREAAARDKEASDIPISSADLDRGDVEDDARKLTPEARKALRDREREVARARSRGDVSGKKAAAVYKRKQPTSWGKPVALFLFLTLLIGAGVANFVPLDTAEYERAASEALGTPVKIGAARLRVLTGVELRFERVSVGEAVKIAEVRAIPELSSLLGRKNAFSRLELEKAVVQQAALGDALFGTLKQSRLQVARVVAKALRLQGPLALGPVDVDATIGPSGRIFGVKLSGEQLNGLVTPRQEDIGFEVSASAFDVPFVDKLSLADFSMKGSADRAGMTLTSFDGRLYDGTVVGKARVEWDPQWSVQGTVEGRVMNAAVFSPQMVSEGRFDGKGRFAMSGAEPAKLHEAARLDGEFTVTKGALGSFDVSRALQSSSAQASGRTPFSEMEGRVSLANGALAFRDLRLAAGLLGVRGSLDVDAKGSLSGRIDAELRSLHGTFYIGGKLGDPQLRR